MKFLLQILGAVALVLLCLCLVMLARFGYRNGLLVHNALWNFASMSYDLKQNSGQQLEMTRKVTADIHDLIGHLDCTLNGCRNIFSHKKVVGLIPTMTEFLFASKISMEHLDDAIQNLDKFFVSGTATMQDIQTATKELQQTVADLDLLVTDPNIKAELAELLQVTKDIDVTAKQANALLASGTASAEDVRQIMDHLREQYTKARNIWYAILKELLGLGYQTRGLLGQ